MEERAAKVAPEAKQATPQDRKDNAFSIQVVGIGIFLSALLITLLGLLSEEGKWAVIGVSTLMAFLGVIIFFIGRKQTKNI